MAESSARERTSAAVGVVLVAVALLGSVVLLAVGRGAPWATAMGLVLALVGAASAALLLGLPLWQTRRELSRVRAAAELHLRASRGALEELRHGDLVAALQPGRSAGGELERAVEAASRALGGLIQQIQGSSVEVATAARTVQETAAELASASTEQAAAVVEITATMEELARTAGQIAANAASQADLASRAEQAGDDGVQAVELAVSGVEAVRAKMDDIAGRADTLGTRSREIYRVLDLIREIAQETHILSLNAAIEAAAAGEHGDRFSVVADEVRRLAERSRESIESVRSLLEEFTGAIRAVVVATEEGSKAACQVLEQSRSTETSIEQLRGALADTARAAREISLATQEQRSASDQVVLTLKEVSEVIQRLAAGQKQFSGTADRLNQLGLSIQLLAQSFRLASNHSLKHQVVEGAASLSSAVGNPEALDGALHGLLRSYPYAEVVFLVDPQGVMASFVTNPELTEGRELSSAIVVGKNLADRPWFQAVTRDGRTVVTQLYDSILTGEPCFTIATPVRDLGGEVAGTLGLDINVRHWTRI